MSREKMAADGMIGVLEHIYGPYSSPAIVQVVIDYVSREVYPDCLEELTRAILRSHPTRLGAPDVAAFEQAVEKAEKRGESLRRSHEIPNWSSSPVLLTPPTEDERGQQLTMKRQAEAVGIDTTGEYWITSYIMHECARHARENGREKLKGDKSK